MFTNACKLIAESAKLYPGYKRSFLHSYGTVSRQDERMAHYGILRDAQRQRESAACATKEAWIAACATKEAWIAACATKEASISACATKEHD